MPRGDKTGPNGEGPMTGRKMGFCSGNNQPGFKHAETDNEHSRRKFRNSDGQRRRRRLRQSD